MKEVGPKNKHFFYIIWKIGQNQGFWPFLTASFFRFHQDKKKLNSNLNHFQQLVFHTFPPSMNLIALLGFDVAYHILLVYLQKFCNFFLQILIICHKLKVSQASIASNSKLIKNAHLGPPLHYLNNNAWMNANFEKIVLNFNIKF